MGLIAGITLISGCARRISQHAVSAELIVESAANACAYRQQFALGGRINGPVQVIRTMDGNRLAIALARSILVFAEHFVLPKRANSQEAVRHMPISGIPA